MSRKFSLLSIALGLLLWGTAGIAADAVQRKPDPEKQPASARSAELREQLDTLRREKAQRPTKSAKTAQTKLLRSTKEYLLMADLAKLGDADERKALINDLHTATNQANLLFAMSIARRVGGNDMIRAIARHLEPQADQPIHQPVQPPAFEWSSGLNAFGAPGQNTPAHPEPMPALDCGVLIPSISERAAALLAEMIGDPSAPRDPTQSYGRSASVLGWRIWWQTHGHRFNEP